MNLKFKTEVEANDLRATGITIAHKLDVVTATERRKDSSNALTYLTEAFTIHLGNGISDWNNCEDYFFALSDFLYRVGRPASITFSVEDKKTGRRVVLILTCDELRTREVKTIQIFESIDIPIGLINSTKDEDVFNISNYGRKIVTDEMKANLTTGFNSAQYEHMCKKAFMDFRTAVFQLRTEQGE